MSTALDMYLNQIVLVNGIPFSVTLPNFDVSKISKEELSTKLKEGYDDYLNNDVEDVTTVFDDLKKTINENLQNSYNKISTKNIENIFDYIAFSLLSYDSAKKQINKIEKSYLFFKTIPNKYKLLDEELERLYGLHRMIVSNYMICFIVDDNKVTITNVLYVRSNVHFRLLKSFK